MFSTRRIRLAAASVAVVVAGAGIVDAFVFNFKTHTVYDYAPGSASPESAGTITVKHAGQHRIP